MVLSGVCPMDDISWADLNPAEQHAIAALGAGIPVGLCDAAAVRRLRRAGLVRGSYLTRKAGQLRKAEILQNLANIRPTIYPNLSDLVEDTSSERLIIGVAS